MKTNYIYIFCICLLSNLAMAQMENKITLSASLALPMFKSAGEIQGENIYNGYGMLPAVRVGLQYNLNARFGLGPVLSQVYSSKPNYTLTQTSFGIGLKYNILPSDKKISPFVYLEGDVCYVTIAQKANSVQENPSVDDKEHIKLIGQTRNYPEIQTGFSSLGAIVGIGSDFTVKSKYTLFFAINYVLTNAASTYTSKNNFEDNTSKLQYLMPQIGIRFSLGKKKSLY